MKPSARTPRWRGSVEPKATKLGIPCGGFRTGASANRRPPGTPWYFRYHDWFCANHPPVKPALA